MTFPSGETYVVMDSDTEDFGAYVQNQLLTMSFAEVTDRDCDDLQYNIEAKSRFDNTLATFMPSQPEKHLGEASTFEEYWRVIYQSLWPDGTPVTSGGDGYNITDTARLNYIFQGDLRDSTDWNEYSINGMTGVKDRIYASVVSPVLQAQSLSSSTLTSHSFLSQSSRSTIYDQCKTLRDFTYTFVFNSERWQYSELCNRSVSTAAPVDARESLSPNPTSGVVRLHYLAKSLRVVDASGRSLLVKKNVSTIDLTSLPTAVYFLIVETDTSINMFKVAKI